ERLIKNAGHQRGQLTNQFHRPLTFLRGAKAACSVQTSPSGWCNQPTLVDFHELRQGFSPRRFSFPQSSRRQILPAP
ncbi:MAG TPA: hypothetical protein PLV64_24815, partial [Anaerolineales bacterium]|nr:hypothetical protein [Anaerolineales bacterium]